ncbi:MAG TPA: hypothetical protein VE782_05590 [Myxococcaceae bacterium]|nr:hypothetical protein [Myxococcaceae bacterium]
MPKIKEHAARGSVFRWGAPKGLRERLVNRSQLERARKARRKGDPKHPALASAALMDFIGAAHSGDELRLPSPPQPGGRYAELTPFSDRPNLQAAVERGVAEKTAALERALRGVSAVPKRMAELEILLGRERRMLERLARLHGEIEEIQRRVREEQKESGY